MAAVWDQYRLVQVFHRTVQQLFNAIEGVGVFIDGVVVWGSTEEEHDEILRKFLDKTKSSGLKPNNQKCQFGARDSTYLGERLKKKKSGQLKKWRCRKKKKTCKEP